METIIDSWAKLLLYTRLKCWSVLLAYYIMGGKKNQKYFLLYRVVKKAQSY